ncbi:MAG TPA: sigma-70 family RNA polymerase sigma factor [Acidimicrobiales bacterium]|nr:sigma-70 family RNA polymerase sigma factor [Acidimicrobiales bacterium]
MPVQPSFDADTAARLGLFAYNVARKFFPCRADLVEEAVQETLTRTCERWERANQRGALEGWVVNTATHVCREKLREERRGARFAPVAGVQWDGGDSLVRSELLADSLRRLSRRQRLVVVWRYLFDFSVSDTADALGLTESKVKDAGHNGVQRLRRMLGDQWSDWA